MPDKYPDFETLSQNERSGIDYRIVLRRAKPEFAIVAPHGGGIEPGTSEIADAIADEDFSFYAFDGIKPKKNADLHITSTNFDEPMCFTVLGETEVVVTIHGEHSEGEGEGVFVGGRDERLGRRLTKALRASGFVVGRHTDPDLQGIEPENVCNRGTSGAGVQLEISRGVREKMFSSLSRAGRAKKKKPKFHAFVKAIRSVLKP